MKRMITSALAILLLAGAAQAQSKDKKADKAERRQEMKELNLTDAQKAKLKDIHTREKAEMDALRGNTALTDAQRRDQGRQLHQKFMAERKAVLTPDQQKKAADFLAERREERGDRKDWRGGRDGDERRDTIRRRGGDGPAGGPRADRGDRFAKMEQELNLTPDQQQKVRAIRDDYRGRLDAVRNDNSLSKEQKRAKFQELMKGQMEQMKSVLTPEQQQKAKALRKERKQNAR